MDIEDLLNQYAEIKSQIDLLHLDLDVRRAEIMETVMPQLQALEAEAEPMLAAASEKMTVLENEIKAAVITAGASVKGTHFQAVYTKGRVAWDSKKLDGMMALIPGLEAARSVGAPTVSIRANKT